MIDITSLAQQAVTVLGPALSAAASTAAGHAADDLLKEPSKKLMDWLNAKLKGTPAAGSLDRAVAEPENKRRLEALRLEIEEKAEKDDAFRDELAKLLNEIYPAGVSGTQTTTQIGDNNKGVNIIGTDNQIHIG
jgi:hypothetical protein